jgi:hypothetical protein
MISAGASLDSVRVPESAGGGYLAQLGGFHDLHCLRVLWYDHHSEEIPETKKSKLEKFHKPEGFLWEAPDDAHLVRVVDRVAQWDEPRVDKDGNEL